MRLRRIWTAFEARNAVLGMLGAAKLSSGLAACSLDKVLPAYVTDTLREGITSFGRKLAGYADGGALLTGVETRTSAPVRIERDRQSYVSLTHDLLYPCGEGAGYAGGIMSGRTLTAYHVARAIMGKIWHR